MGLDPHFWRGKKILLTGHTGFKGGWALAWLHMLGAEVCGYSLPPASEPNLYNLIAAAFSHQHVVGDMRDAEKILHTVKSFQPELVCHFAAQSLVRLSYQDPLETYSVNVLGTANLLQAIRAQPSVRAAVIVTSDKCYENINRGEGYREDAALGGYDPYSSSKACAELVVSAYRRSFFSATNTAVATARAGNVIGGGDWAQDRLIPDAMRAFSKNQTLTIRNPDAIRPWQHVLESLYGYFLLLEKLFTAGQPYAQAWNFGPDATAACSVRDVVEQVCKLYGGNARWQQEQTQQPHEADSLTLNAGKAQQQLAWHSQLTLKQALELTVNWYLAANTSASAVGCLRQQLEDYQQRVLVI